MLAGKELWGKGKKAMGAILRPGRWRALFLDNASVKFVALVLSVTLFILVNTIKDPIHDVDVAVVYTLPEDRVLVSEKVNVVRATIKMSRLNRRIDPDEIGPLRVDLNNLRTGEYLFNKDSIALPPGLTILSLNPRAIQLRFESLELKTLLVDVPVVGQPKRGYKVDRISPRPSQVAVRGAEGILSNTQRVSTRELNLTGRSKTFTETLTLVTPRPAPIFDVIDGTAVDVEVVLVEEMSTRRLEQIPVEFRLGAGMTAQLARRYQAEPAAVDVVLHGPLLSVEGFSGKCVAYVELHPDDSAGRSRKATVHIANAPAGVGIEIVPKIVQLKSARE